MSQYTSYYLYQKYEKRGDQPWLPSYPNVYSVDGDGTMPLVVKMEDDPSCGYIPPPTPIYRWIDLDPSTDWICSSCDVKASGTYESGQTFTIDCNGSTTLESGDTTGFTGLEYIRIGDCVTEIGTEALQARPNLVGATIPPSVTSIGNRAFFNDAGIEDCAIPQSVTSIGSEAFRNCISLRNVMLWDSITAIGASAFTNCDFIIDINIPTGLTSISSSCFRDCGALSEVTIPPTITSIGDNAFNGCTGLMSITCLAQVPPTLGSSAFSNTNDCEINVPCDSFAAYQTAWSEYADRLQPLPPCEITGKFVALYTNGNQYVVPCNDNPTLTSNETKGYSVVSYEYMLSADIGDCVTAIGADAFAGCSSLTNVTIPDSVVTISGSAFYGCSALTSVSIPSGVTSISTSAFRNDNSLSSITVDANNTVYDSRNNCNAIINTSTNTLIQGCKNTTIPDTVTTIGDYAFLQCTGLTSITIPSSVTTIGDGAFESCRYLTGITIENTTPPTLVNANSVFRNTNNSPIFVPYSAVETYKNMTPWSSFADRIRPIDAPTGYMLTLTYNDSTVYNLDYISDTVTQEEVRGGTSPSTAITSAVIGDNVIKIGTSAFDGCYRLSSVTIGSGVTNIGASAFANCGAIDSLTINATTPPTINYAGTFDDTFYHTTLRAIYVPCSRVDVFKTTSGWDSFSSVIEGIPPCGEEYYRWVESGTTCIGYDKYQNNIRQVSYDNVNWENVVPNEFSASTLIEAGSVDCGAPQGYKWIAIDDNTRTTSAQCDSSSAISRYEIGVASNTRVIVGDCVTSIGAKAFYQNSNLKSIDMPDSVTSIGNNAFYKCSGMTSVTIGSGVTTMGDYSFRYCSALTSATIKATTPPSFGYYMFNDTNSSFIIYVPSESVALYKNTSGWSSFGSRIQAIP